MKSMLVGIAFGLVVACTTNGLMVMALQQPLLSSSKMTTKSLLVSESSSRRNFLGASAAAIIAGVSTSTISPSPSMAADDGKLRNISNEEFAKIIESDVLTKQYMVTALITRELYDESATFQDEIDTYQMDQWIKGTQRLFVAKNSDVRLIPDSLIVTPTECKYRFDENLQFNIPFKPIVALSGEVILTRDPQTGLITKYREIWDQDISTVLKSAVFK